MFKDCVPNLSNKTSSFGFLRGSNVFGYKLHLLRLALLDGRPFKFNLEAKACCFNRTNTVFLLAMIKNKPKVVYSMLASGFPGSINAPIFGGPMFPTYFQLACAMHQDVLSAFLDFSPNYRLPWNGLTPQMIASFGGKNLEIKQPFGFVTMKQYRLLNMLRGIEVAESSEKPLFLVDFLCMEDDMEGARRILDRNPELARVNKLCYLVQNSTEWIVLLSRYQTSVHQEFNGLSPLHLSAMNGMLEELAALAFLGAHLNAKDGFGNTPMHYCAARGHVRCLELLMRIGGNLSMVNRDGISTEDIMLRKNIVLDVGDMDAGIEDALLQMLGDSGEYRRFLSVAEQLKYNSEHVILKKSRFTISSLLNLPHKIDYTEALIQKAQRHAWRPERHSPASSLRLFEESIE